MNKNIRMIYMQVLKHGYSVKVVIEEDGIYGLSLYKKKRESCAAAGTKPYVYIDERLFYLYPRNPYTGGFCDE